MIKEECGVFGVWNNPDAAFITYLGLYGLQHRGQESCGIVSSDGSKMYRLVGMGKVMDFFNEDNLISLKGSSAIGHVRYSTTGVSDIKNAQPLAIKCGKGDIAIAHNGNLVNVDRIRNDLIEYGSIFQTSTDSEIIIHLIAKSRERDIIKNITNALNSVDGAFSVVMLTNDMLIAARDGYGFRPLVIGRLGDGYVVSSETTSFSIIGAKPIREVKSGELIAINNNGIHSFALKRERCARCIFELIYFAKPDSIVFGESVYRFRFEAGRRLAREFDVEADVVIPVPDSGSIAAMGFSKEANIPFRMGLIRSHYIGRTFIEPTQGMRDFSVRIKFAPVREVIEGKRVVVIDDSIVRGTTAKKIIKRIREAGAKEIYLAIASPPIKHPCFFGIDFPDKTKLIAYRDSISDIARFLGVDKLHYLSMEGLKSSVSEPDKYCLACFNGHYPTTVGGHNKMIFD